ncbi:MAG: biopolymer transporter ExbD [Deltaproteobacteria bacterium]|nr:biopolymer transporter ExbD [Deltaproteobacteria bacterium]
MAGSSKNSEEYSPFAEINITPLVDVMLVLLIIFMVTAPLLENGIAVQLPKASGKALPKDELPVTLHITEDRKLYLGREVVLPSDLISRLQNLYKNRAKKEIYIRADGTLPYSFVVQSMAAIKQAGVSKIGLVTLPPDSKESTAAKYVTSPNDVRSSQ